MEEAAKSFGVLIVKEKKTAYLHILIGMLKFVWYVLDIY